MQVSRLLFVISFVRRYEPGWPITIFCPVYVTFVGRGEILATVNPLGRVALRPSRLVTTTFQEPVAAIDGIPNWQVIFVGETTTTFAAGTSAEPVRVSLTFAPAWNSVPARFVTATVEPCIPVFGAIDVTPRAQTVIMPVRVSVSDCPSALPTVSETV